MKTSKAKTISNPKKTATTTKSTGKKKAAPAKYVPTEEEIREKAMEIYFERISHGEHGTAESDWHEAEEILKG